MVSSHHHAKSTEPYKPDTRQNSLGISSSCVCTNYVRYDFMHVETRATVTCFAKLNASTDQQRNMLRGVAMQGKPVEKAGAQASRPP